MNKSSVCCIKHSEKVNLGQGKSNNFIQIFKWFGGPESLTLVLLKGQLFCQAYWVAIFVYTDSH